MSDEARVYGLEDVIARARSRGLQCVRERARVIVSGNVDGWPSVAAITWNHPRGVALFSCGAPVKVTASNRAALVAAVADINANLAVLGLVVRRAGVYFTAHAYLDADGGLSTRVFERSLDLVFAGITQHRQALKAAARGEAEP